MVEFGLSLWARLEYVRQVMEWAQAVLNAWTPVKAIDNWLKRWFEYWFLDLPLYNAMLGVHWCFSLYGVTLPLPHEVNPGLTTLGVGVDLWGSIYAVLSDPRGGLDRPGPSAGDSEPSGLHEDKPLDPSYPRDAVTDHASNVGKTPQCGHDPDGQAASEYLTPWQFPLTRSSPPQLVPTELPTTMPGPYVSGQDAKVLMGGSPGDSLARDSFEGAQRESETIAIGQHLLPQGRHLGDPIDYTAYVVARLTRQDTGTVTNFNLDADRGYGSLCWDWLRSQLLMATPAAWTGNVAGIGPYEHRTHPQPGQPSDPRAYHAPLQPGFGWCAEDLATRDNPQVDAAGQPLVQPIVHDTTALPNDPGQKPVLVRYLDLQPK